MDEVKDTGRDEGSREGDDGGGSDCTLLDKRLVCDVDAGGCDEVAELEEELRRLELGDVGTLMRVALAGCNWLLDEVVLARRMESVVLLDDWTAIGDRTERWTPVTT